MTDQRTIPADLARWHWLTSAASVYRLTNGDYTTKAHGQPGQAFAEARAYLRRSALIARCAAHGWILQQNGDGWELMGNGAPAAFRSTESLTVWLEKQEKGKQETMDDLRDLPLFAELEAA